MAAALRMPSSYAPVEAEEMEYLDGGLAITRKEFSYTLSIAIGAVVTALTAGIGTIFATAALRVVLASYSLRLALAKAIVKGIGIIGIAIGNSASTIAGGIVGCAAGDLAGYVFDKWIDTKDGVFDGKYRLG